VRIDPEIVAIAPVNYLKMGSSLWNKKNYHRWWNSYLVITQGKIFKEQKHSLIT
jgi:hypothetical protein